MEEVGVEKPHVKGLTSVVNRMKDLGEINKKKRDVAMNEDGG